MGEGLDPDPYGKSLIECAQIMSANEKRTAKQLRGIECAGTVYNNVDGVSAMGTTIIASVLVSALGAAILWRSRL